jgi:hypothetical protein
LHTTAPVNTNSRSGCRSPFYTARDTDATFRWVLGAENTCWFTGGQPGVSAGSDTACAQPVLPLNFEPVAW